MESIISMQTVSYTVHIERRHSLDTSYPPAIDKNRIKFMKTQNTFVAVSVTQKLLDTM